MPVHFFPSCAAMDYYYNLSDERYLSGVEHDAPDATGYYTGQMTNEHMAATYLQHTYDYYAYPAYPFVPAQTADSQYFSASGYTDPAAYAEPYCPQLPLHAPIPISGYSTLIPPTLPPSSPPSPAQAASVPASPTDYSPPSSQSSACSAYDTYTDAPQVTFPTPSELLNHIATRVREGLPLSETRGSPGAERSASPDASEDRDDQDLGPQSKKSSNSGKQPESQRKAYFRAVAESVGFQPTDPDTITSHDKKRSYLECLEQYVQWLHEQIRAAGHEPVPLERVSTYRGLTSRSIRTLLVHMQDETRRLHQQTLDDERTFMQLQQLVTYPTSDSLHALRRHSVPTDTRQAPFFPARH